MASILFYGYGGNYNRGCEAIARGTMSILQRHLSKVDICVASNHWEMDRKTDLGPDLKWTRSRSWGKLAQSFPLRYIYAFERRVLRRSNLQLLQYRPTVEASKGVDVAFSVGGDNYFENAAIFLSSLDQRIRKQCQRMVLWGCSLDPQFLAVSHANLATIKAFNLITARESITYQGLLDQGIFDGVYLHADPAFAMSCDQTTLPDGFLQGNTIGINVSPLIGKFEAVSGMTLKSIASLIKYIISQTDMKVVLVPHVVFGSDDRVPLSQLYGHFRDTGRVILLDGTLNSPQTKYVISQCRLFIGARTHSTIAAYSTCVPTLALGYSVKSRGIARDIFGSEDGLMLPVQTLTDDRQIIQAFESLRTREDELRRHLKAFMPSYIQSAWDAGSRVASLLQQ